MKNSETVMNLLMDDTIKNKITWKVFRESAVYRAYESSIILTKKKKLQIVLNFFTSSKQLTNVQFYLINGDERKKLEDIGFYFASRQITELLSILEEKYIKGELKK